MTWFKNNFKAVVFCATLLAWLLCFFYEQPLDNYFLENFDGRNYRDLVSNPYYEDAFYYRKLRSQGRNVNILDTQATASGDGEDDHSSDHPPLFGALTHIESTILSYSLLVVVAAVVAVEGLFHLLHCTMHDTPFLEIIVAIEKELMIVGCTAFILKIVINTSNFLNDEWFFALEFADLLVPMFSFSNSMIGIVLTFMSLSQCDIWSRAFHLKTEEIMDDFYDHTTGLSRFLWAPVNKGINQIEFRIFHDIFCDLYRIQRNAFAFDQYVQKVYEEFVLSIIEIRLINWAIFVALLLLNMVKSNSNNNLYECEDDHDYECQNRASVRTFTYGGIVVFLITCVFVAISRRYELLIIRKRGIASIHEYPTFIQWVNSNPEGSSNGSNKEDTRMDEEELKRVMLDISNSAKQHGVSDNLADMMSAVTTLSTNVTMMIGQDSIQQKPLDAKQDRSTFRRISDALAKSPSRSGSRSPVSGRSRVGENDHVEISDTADCDQTGVAETPAGDPDTNSNSATTTRALSKRYLLADRLLQELEVGPDKISETNAVLSNHVAKNTKSSSRVDDYDNIEVSGTNSSVIPTVDIESGAAVVHSSPKVSHSRIEGTISNVSNASKRSDLYTSDEKPTPCKYHHQKPAYIKNVFFLSRPELYFEAVQLLIMIISLYLSLWLVNYCSAEGVSNMWKFGSFLPFLFSALNYTFIVKSAALLKAVYNVDREAVLEVLEQTEGSRVLGETIRLKLLSRLSAQEPYQQIKQLFDQIDGNRSGSLSRIEFEYLMSKLHINFSRKKWAQIYREIDKNYDNQVTFEEFFVFLYPHHQDSVEIERRRLVEVKKRVAEKSLRASSRRRGGGLFPVHTVEVKARRNSVITRAFASNNIHPSQSAVGTCVNGADDENDPVTPSEVIKPQSS